METKRSAPTKVLSLFLSVLMALSCFSVALPGLVPKASAAGSMEQLDNAFKVALDAGYMSTSDWTGINTPTAGRVVVVDNTTEGLVYDIVRALAEVVKAEATVDGSYNHNTKLADYIIDELDLNVYQQNFVKACLPADGDYADFDGVNGQWNGSEADRAGQKKVMTLEVARSIGTAVVADYTSPADVPSAVETSVTLRVEATLKAVAPTLEGAETGGVYVNSSATVTPKTTNLTAAEKDQLIALKNYLAYVGSDPFKADYDKWYANGEKLDHNIYMIAGDELVANYEGFMSVYPAAASAEQAWIECFVGQTYMNDHYTFATKCNAAKAAADYKKYVDWIMPETSMPILDRDANDELIYNARDNYSRTDRASLVKALATGTALKAIMDNCPASTKALLAEQYGYANKTNFKGESKDPFAAYCDDIQHYIDIYDLQDMQIASDWLLSHGADDTFSFNNENSIFYVEGSDELKGIGKNEYVASAYGVFVLTDDETVKEGKTYYTDATGSMEVANPVDANVATYYEANGDLCPITTDELQLIYNFYVKAVAKLTSTDYSGIISEADAQKIRDTKEAVEIELNSRSIATNAYLIKYGWFVKKTANMAIPGTSVDTLINTIAEAETNYTQLTGAYTGTFKTKDQATNKFYDGENTKIRAFIDEMYYELYSRAYSWISTTKGHYGSGISFSNYYAVYGDLVNQDKTLWTWVTGHTSAISGAAGRLGKSVNISYLTSNPTIAAMQAAVDNFTVSNVYNSITQTSKGSFTRYGGAYGDFARKAGNKNFTVNTANGGNLQKTVNKIDTFLANEHFAELINADEEGYHTLGDFIKGILVENIFSDSMMNTLLALLFPMLANLFDETLTNLLYEQINGKDLGDLAGNSDIGGTIYLYFDGKRTNPAKSTPSRDTSSFIQITHALGLEIYPSTFGAYLKGQTSAVSQANAIGTWIASAGRNWSSLDADGDGEFKAEDIEKYFKDHNLSWGIDSIKRENYSSMDAFALARFNKAKTVLGAFFGAANDLLRTVFTDTAFSKRLNGSGDQNLLYAYVVDFCYDWTINLSTDGLGLNKVDANLNISGVDLYHKAWIPLLECLGVYGDLDNNNYSFPTLNGSNYNGANLCNALLNPIYHLIEVICAKPVESVLKLLPNVAFHLMNGSIKAFIDSTSLNIGLKINNADLCDGEGFLSYIAQWDWVTSIILNFAADALTFDIPLELGSLIDLNDMLGFDLTNLNAIIQGVLGMIVGTDDNDNPVASLHLPSINTAKLAGAFSSRSTSKATQRAGGSRTYFSAATSYQQVLYLVLDWVLRAAKTPGFVADVLDFIAKLGGNDPIELPSIIFTVLDGIRSTDDVIAALVELFNPQDYNMDDMAWYNKTAAGGVGTLNLTLSDFVYLKYGNDWTEDKAQYLYDNIDNIVNSVINMIDPDLLKDYDGSAGKWLNAFVNSMFNNEGIWNVVNLLTDIGAKLSETPALLKIIKQQLKGANDESYNTDLLVWFNDFGYANEEYTKLETDKTVLGEDYVTGEYVEYDSASGQAYVYARVRAQNSDLSTPGNPVYYTYNANDPITYKTKELRAYPNSAYWISQGRPASYNANFTNLTALTTGHENEDGEFIRDWQLKLTAESAQFIDGANAGEIVKLVDGSDNARAVFTAMFNALLGPIAPLFGLVLSGENLELFGALELNGYPAYNAALVPILEALGVTGIPTQAEFNAMSTQAGFNMIINLLFQALGDILTDTRVYDANGNVISGKGPFQNVIDVLPHLFYVLQSGGISTLLKNGLMFVWTLLDTVRPIADINLDDAVHQLLCTLLGYCYDPEDRNCDTLITAVLDLIGLEKIPYSKAKEKADREKVDAIFSLSLSDLSLTTIFTVVKAFTNIDLTPITYAFEGMAVRKTVGGVNYGVTKMTSVSSSAANNQRYVTSVFKQPGSNVQESYTVNFRGADVITVTISVILDLLRYQDNAKAIDELIGLSREKVPGDMLGGLTATGLLDAIEIIFEDSPHSGKIKRPNWDYLFEGKNVKDPTNGNLFAWIDIDNPGDDDAADDATQWAELIKQTNADLSMYHSMYNLEYVTDWTEVVAKDVVTLLEGVLDYVAALLGSDKGFDAWFREDILGGYLFNADMLATIVDLLAMIYDLVPEAIRDTIDKLLDVDMSAWEDSGMIIKYSAESIYDLYIGLKDKLEWTTVTYSAAAAYDEDEDYYILSNGEYKSASVLNADAFAADTFYTKTVTKHSEDQYTYSIDGEYIYVTKMAYGYADDQYVSDDTLKEGAVKTYHATDDVNVFKQDENGNYVNIKVEDEEETVKSSYTVNTSYKWFDPASPEYVHDKDTFLDAIEEIVMSAKELIGYIFLEDSFKVFYTGGDDLTHSGTADDTDAIAINGIGLYGLLFVPALEALKIDLTNYKVEKYRSVVDGKTVYNTELFVTDFFDIAVDMFDSIMASPLEWLLDIFPSFIYFINAGGLSTCISNTFGVLQEVIDAINMLLDSDSQIGMIIAGIDLNNTTLAGLFSLIENFIPGFYINEELVDFLENLYIGQLSVFDSASGYKGFRMDYTTVEEKHDLITILVAIVIEVLTDKGEFVDPNNDYQLSEYDNAKAIAGLIGEEYEDVVSEIVSALKNPTTVDYKDITWDYFDKTLDLANKEVPSGANTSVTIPAFAFQYLNYTTAWKYDKAVTTVDGLESMVLAILKMVNEDQFGDINGLGDLINTDAIFNGETAQSLLDLLSGLLFSDDAVIPGELLALVGAILGADITDWDYKYQFVSELEAGKTVEGNENGLDYYTGAVYENVYAPAGAFDAAQTYYTAKNVYTKVANPVAEDIANYYTKAGQGDTAVYTPAAVFTEGTRYFTKEVVYETVKNASAENVDSYFVLTQQATGDQRKTYIVNDASTFASAVALILQPAGRLLAWLLFDDSYEFFVGNTESSKDDILLTIPGGNGYETGLVLLLEALGLKGLGYATRYTSGSADDATGLKGYDLFLYDLAHSLVNRINEIIANPIEEIVALIPEIIYFINANGLGVVVNNLLAGPLELVSQVPSVIKLINEDIDPDAIENVVDDLVEGILQDALNNDELTFTMDGVNLKWIMELVEAITGLEITDVLQNSLDMFYIGALKAYASKARTVAYKMEFDTEGFINGGNGDMADFLTILLSFVIDLVCYKDADKDVDNGAALAELVGIDPALVQTIVKFIHDGFTVSYDDIDWFYFDDEYALYEVVDGKLVRKTETVGTGDEAVTKPTTPAYTVDTAITVPYNTINYLTYASDWTEDTAKYITAHRNEIIEAVLSMAKVDGTVADIIAGVFDPKRDLYTADVLNSILDLIKPLAESIPSVLLDLLGIILDIDLSVYADMDYYDEDNFTDGSRAMFVNEITEMLKPLSMILDWLLFGKNIQYFDKKDLDSGDIEVLINLKGAEGYKYGLIPILEALGVVLPTLEEGQTTEDVLYVVINNVLARVEAILANPVDEVINLIPELLYFINTNALATSVHNLLAGVFSLVEEVASTGLLNGLLDIPEGEEVDINGVVNNLLAGLGVSLDITKLDLVEILKVVRDLTKVSYTEYALTSDTELVAGKTYYKAVVSTPAEGEEATVSYKAIASDELNVADIAGYYEANVTHTSAGVDLISFCTEKKIDQFYFGKLVGFISANTQVAFKMVFDNEQDIGDLLTVIVNLVLEYLMDEDNAKAVDCLINGINEDGDPNKATVGAIVKVLLGLKSLDDVDPEAIDWDYFLETGSLSTTGINVPTAKFVYLDYSNMWTEELATGLGAGLTDMINQILALTAGAGEEPKTLDQLLSGLVDLDGLLNADLLNSILDLVSSLFYGEDSVLAVELLSLIGLVLGADLTEWDNAYRFEQYDEANTYSVEAATGLKYREGTTADGEFTGLIYAISNASDFASGLAVELKPIQKLLGWLLLGNDYRFFVTKDTGNVNADNERQDDELLIIPGFNGYDLSLTLLLEALGLKGLKHGSDYAGNEAALVKDIINALITRVDEILANPIDEVLDLIPELLYFINAGGLNAVVMNLVGGLLQVVEYVNESGLLDSAIEINGYTLDRNIIDVLVDGILNDALKDMLDKDNDGVLSDSEKITFALKNINIDWILAFAEKISGLTIRDAIGKTYDLSKFAIGDIVRYNSASTAYDVDGVSQTYKAVSSAKVRGDIITIVLSLVLDIIEYKNVADGVDNAVVLADLLKDVADGKITVTVIDSVIAILQGWEDNVKYLTPDWFYCVTSPATYTEDITSATAVTLNTRTINYLSYASDWTEETAEYLVENIDMILAEIMKLTGNDSVTSVAGLIGNNFTIQSDLYTAENLNKIVGLVSGLSEQIGDTLADILGMILTVDLSAYKDMSFSEEDIKDRASFVAGLVTVIKPIYTLLDWFLFGKDLAFLYDNDYYNGGAGRDLIHITGGEGYNYSIVPLFEALGIDMPAAVKMNDADLTTVLNNVLAKVEGILADPVDEVLALIPNLIYFINANGLSVVVNNLLASVLALIDTAAPLIIEFVGNEIVIDEDAGIKIAFTDANDNILSVDKILNNLINALLAQNGIDFEIDYQAIDLLVLVKVIEAFTGLKIVDVVTANKIDKFYIGKITYFESANGKPAFRMAYSTEEEAHDMLTIVLNFVVEVLLYKEMEGDTVTFSNVDALCKLLGLEDNKDMINAIVELLTNPKEYDYKKVNWNYYNGTVVLDTIPVPKSQFIYLAYANDWTFAKAAALDAGLVNMVDTIIGMIAKDGDPTTLGELLSGAVDIDKLLGDPSILNSIIDLLQGLLFGEDAVLGQSLIDLVGLVFNAELTDWDGNYTFEEYDAARHTSTDAATGLRYIAEDGKIRYGIENADDLIAGLCKILEPATDILGFLLLGKDYGFFVDNETGENILIKIKGAKGYANGLALLLEALGVEGLESNYANANVMLKSVLTCIVNRVKDILANPINEVFALITEIIYFINAGGLNAVVKNLAAAAFNILDALEQAGLGKLLDVDGLIDGLIKGALGDDAPAFTLEGVNIEWLVKLGDYALTKYLGMPTFTHGEDTIGVIEETLYSSLRSETLYPLSTLAIGKAVKYNSVSDFSPAYKMVFGDGTEEGGASRGDMITIILSFIINLVRTPGVGDAIEDIEINGEPLLKAGTIADIIAVISDYGIAIDPAIDWFYFDPSYTYDEGADLTMFTPTIQYLSYASDWTEQLADYLDTNLDSIIAAVLDIAGMGDTTVADIIKNVFDPATDLYTAELLNKIALLIANAIKDLQDIILDVANLILDVDLGYYKSICTYDEAAGEFTACTAFTDDMIVGRESFSAGLSSLIAPIAKVLDWLFFGDNFAFFNRSNADGTVQDLLVINGYDGYANGIVPILEALGVAPEDLPNCAEHAANGEYNTNGMLTEIISAVLGHVEQILADPVDSVLALIPNILYFINANGLASAVNHLVGSVLGLLEKAVPAVIDIVGTQIEINDDITIVLADEHGDRLAVKDILNNVINALLASNGINVEINIKNIRLVDILKVIEALTGIELTEFVVENGIENFYVGQITHFTSSNGKPAFKMVYTEDVAKDRADLITILFNYLIEAVLYGDNANAIDLLIGKDEDNDGVADKKVVGAVIDLLNKLGNEAVPGDFHWAYFNEDTDDQTPASDNMALPRTPYINHLAYANDWTQEKANVLYNNVDDVVTAVLTLIAGDDAEKAHNVSELINGSFSLYKAEYLNAILELTDKLYDLLDETLVNTLGMVLGCDLSAWNGLKFTDGEIFDHDTFVIGLNEVIAPLSGILDWLLFGDSYSFFVEDKENTVTLINIAGAKGYIYGLAQILIALGVELPEYQDGYTCGTVLDDGHTYLYAVLDAVLDRVDEILADPVDEVLELIPELLYFINANGVSTAAYNLAGGLLNAANVLFDEGLISLKVGDETYSNIEDYLAASIGLDIRNLDLEGIFSFLEASDIVKGIKLFEVFMGDYTVDPDTGAVTFTADEAGPDNILEKFYVGELKMYTYGGTYGYKMIPETGKEGDIITMLLSIVFDVLFYDGNEEPIAALINDLLGDKAEFTTENFVNLKALIMNGAKGTDGFGYVFAANWAYYLGLSDAELQAKIDEILGGDTTALPALPERTKHYLEYDNNWNFATVDYLDKNVEEIVDLVINMVDSNYDDLEDLIADKLDIFSADIVNKIVNAIANLVKKLDQSLTEELRDTLILTAGTLLGAEDITKLITPVTDAEVYDKVTFVNALTERLGQLNRILDWLFFDKDLEVFGKLADGSTMIKISGGEGYKYGLAPVLAALGVETEITSASCADGALKEVIMNLANRIDDILYGANGNKIIEEALNLIPNIVYFINANGVSEAVMNILKPADELLKIVDENLGNGAVLGKQSVADFFGFGPDNAFTLRDLNFDFIFALVKDKTGIDIAESTGTSADPAVTLGKVGDYIKSFYFGKLETYESFGGVKGVKMVYTEDDTRMDFLTILITLVLDVATSNANKEALIDLLGSEDTYNVILALLTGGEVEIDYKEFNWLFAEFADTGIIISPMTVDGTLYTGLYGPLYTRAMGEYMTKYLQLLIDTYITLLGVNINGKVVKSLEDILKELIGDSIYTNDLLNTIYKAIYNLIAGLREDTLGPELFNHIANVLNNALGVDLNYWNDYQVATIEEGNQAQFIDEVCRLLRPAYPILKWLFTADKLALFNRDDNTPDTVPLDDNDYIYIQGAEGYKYAIIPILEALNNGDNSNILSANEYIAAVEADATGDALLKYILKPILEKVDGILADPINGVLNLLPAVVYFVNSKGLDACFKNLLGSVYMLLEKIDPLIADVEKLHKNGEVSLYPLIGLDLEDLDLESLLRELLDSLKESTGFSLSDLGIDLVKELTMGVIESYDSHINEDKFFCDMLTMKYATSGFDQEGNACDTVDFVTIILRLVLRFIADPVNKDAVKELLKGSLSGDGYTLLASLLDNFSMMVRTEDGMDKVMYTVYYVFYGALVAGVATNNGLAEFNGNYSFLNQLFATSDVAFIRQIEKSLGSWLDNWAGNDIVDRDEVIPNGQISFWQKIINFFKTIIAFFQNMFKK